MNLTVEIFNQTIECNEFSNFSLMFRQQKKMFPVKLTEPLTAILYITQDKEHIEELRHAIHVKEVVEGNITLNRIEFVISFKIHIRGRKIEHFSFHNYFQRQHMNTT